MISEHFCWFVFQSLIDALITFKTGYCREVNGNEIDEEEGRESWVPFLHLDIKPDNIFLTDPGDRYDFYKQPVLADYDSSAIMIEDPRLRDENCSQARWNGTEYWQSPEQCVVYNDDYDYPPSKWPLSASTDIYSVGLVIRYMMMCAGAEPGFGGEGARRGA